MCEVDVLRWSRDGDGESLDDEEGRSLPMNERVGETEGDVAVVDAANDNVVVVDKDDDDGDSSSRRWRSSSCWSCNERYSCMAKSRL